MPADVQVKQEPEEPGSDKTHGEWNVDQIYDKDTENDKDADSINESWHAKEEPWYDLYADHVVKEELVLGPEGVQPQQVCTAKSDTANWSSPEQDRDCKDLTIVKHCRVRLERLSSDAVARWTREERFTDGTQLALKNCWVRLEYLPYQETPSGNPLRHIVDRAEHKTGSFPKKCNIQTETGNGEKLKCGVCRKTFSGKSRLVKHLYTHIYEPINTDECQRAVPIQSNIKLKHNLASAGLRRPTELYVPSSEQTQAKQKNVNHVNPKNTYVCNTCGKIFQQKHCLINHFKMHQRGILLFNNIERKSLTGQGRKEKPLINSEKFKSGALQCETCNRSCTSKYKLNIHQRIHTGEKPYACDICQRRFTTKNNLESHVRTHTKERPYSCDVCQKKFTQATALKTHKRLHTGEKPYSCKICNKVFTQSGHLMRHELVHSGLKIHSCQTCNKQFAEISKLRVHKLIHTGQKPCSCEICGKKFRQLAHLYRHKISHTGERPYFCEICENTFGDAGQLKNHKLIHKGIKPYACKICNKKLSSLYNLKQHLRTHTGEKPYTCEVCKKQCSELGSLRVHMRIHSGEKPYFCEICFARFTYVDTFKAHMRHHTHDLFTCGTCPKQFARSGDLKRHEGTHTGQKRYSCDMCTLQFYEKYTLARHIRTHEKNKHK